jgi:hypothetical protein
MISLQTFRNTTGHSRDKSGPKPDDRNDRSSTRPLHQQKYNKPTYRDSGKGSIRDRLGFKPRVRVNQTPYEREEKRTEGQNPCHQKPLKPTVNDKRHYLDKIPAYININLNGI